MVRLNKENSLVIGGEKFITLLKAMKISKEAQQNVDYNSFIMHPKMGKMVKYNA